MKKFLCILFSIVYLLNFQEVKQLFLLPNLIKHYTSHKKINKNISFKDFLFIHYSNNKIQKDSDHKNLPFKSVHFCSFHEVCTTINQINTIIKTYNFYFFNKKQKIYNYQKYIIFDLITSIWNPPKFNI